MVNAPSVNGSETDEGQETGIQTNQTQTPIWSTHDQAEQTSTNVTAETGTLTEAIRGATVSTQTESSVGQAKPLQVETAVQTN